MTSDELAEIAKLEADVVAARDEFYLLQTEYAAEHFKLQSAMRAAELERLSASAVGGAVSMLKVKCEQFEREIAALRATLRAAGIDPSQDEHT
jgi:outer membrane murein-binding lipoprotein Lpp